MDAVVTDPPYHLVNPLTERYGKQGPAPAQYQTDGAFVRGIKEFRHGAKNATGETLRSVKTVAWALCYELLEGGGHLLAFLVAVHITAWQLR